MVGWGLPTSTHVLQVGRHASSSGGPDGWTRKELKHLPDFAVCLARFSTFPPPPLLQSNR